tara:strand:+ start:235 stop:456 length:222 start_codon:yes stop_codon:yes gene_type:complete
MIVTAMGFAVRNILIKNEQLTDFISKQSDAINECGRRLEQIDTRGTFSSDDEIGWFFQEIKKIQDALNEFTLK